MGDRCIPFFLFDLLLCPREEDLVAKEKCQGIKEWGSKAGKKGPVKEKQEVVKIPFSKNLAKFGNEI